MQAYFYFLEFLDAWFYSHGGLVLQSCLINHMQLSSLSHTPPHRVITPFADYYSEPLFRGAFIKIWRLQNNVRAGVMAIKHLQRESKYRNTRNHTNGSKSELSETWRYKSSFVSQRWSKSKLMSLLSPGRNKLINWYVLVPPIWRYES